MPNEAPTLSARSVARASAPYAGGALAVVCVGLVAWQIVELATELESQLATWAILPGVAGWSLIYGLSLFSLATAWALLVRSSTAAPAVPHRLLVRAYGVSSLNKYLPGNVFHFAGRQLIGARLGSSHASLAVATALEIVLSVLAALLVATTLVAFADSRPAFITPRHAALAWAASIALVVVLERYGRRADLFVRFKLRAPRRGALTASIICCAAFFLSSALIAVGVYTLVLGQRDDAAAIGAAYVFAWVAGYVVPGAPGGLGVREAALFAILAPVVPPANVLALALIMRLVTTLGDALFAAACFFLLPARSRT